MSLTYRTEEGDVPAVRDVDLDLDRGEIVGLAGESGCGKSTLASTILRLQPASARVTGEVLFEGEDVLTMSWGDLRALRWAGASMVFQGALHSLNPVRGSATRSPSRSGCTTRSISSKEVAGARRRAPRAGRAAGARGPAPTRTSSPAGRSSAS